MEVGVEGGAVGVGDGDEAAGDEDVAVAGDGVDLVESDDEGTVDPHETVSRQLVFHRFHRIVGHERLRLRSQVQQHIVFHSFHVADIRDVDFPHLPVDLHEERLTIGRGPDSHRRRRRSCRLLPFHQREPLLRLADGLQEFLVANGLEQEIKRRDFIALEGVLLECGRKDDARLRRNHAREREPVKIGHLDIEEQ